MDTSSALPEDAACPGPPSQDQGDIPQGIVTVPR